MTKLAKQQLFRMPVEITTPLKLLEPKEKYVFLGSCFAEHIGMRFVSNRLQTVVNPLGVMYNPMSIARILTTNKASDRDLAEREGMWHTWLGDSSLSRPSKAECRQSTDKALTFLHQSLAKADRLFLTLGTSHYYTLQDGGKVVANCHRFPSSTFNESELSTDEIVAVLNEAITLWHKRNPRLRVVFTISPYRYAKYGMHENQLSKSRLLLAVDALQKLHREFVEYFPAYEIVMDELRDYRFYASDMLHPSEQAVEYIWQRLAEEWMSHAMVDYLERYRLIRLTEEHKTINPFNPATEALRMRTTKLQDELKKDYPYLNI